MTISENAEYRRADYRFERQRCDRAYIPLQPSEPIRGYAREIARLLGIAMAGCLLLVALLAVAP